MRVSKVNESLELSDSMKEMKAGNRDRGQENGQEGERRQEEMREGRWRVKGTGIGRQKEVEKDSKRNGTEDRYVPTLLLVSLYAAELHLIQEVQTVPSSERVRAYNPTS